MSRCNTNSTFSGLDNALKKLFAAKLNLGRESLNLLGAGCSSAKDMVNKLCPPSNGCHIPEPCWMPQKIDELCCSLSKCDIGEVCLLVCNEDFVPHDYNIQAAGEHSSLVQISTDSFTLGPKERRVVSLKFELPSEEKMADPSCCLCDDYELVIWVLGCQQHYLNWYIKRDKHSSDCCHELRVVDKPDYELHWYDHFHVYRPCSKPAGARD